MKIETGYEYTTTDGGRYWVAFGDGGSTIGCKEYKWNGYEWVPVSYNAVVGEKVEMGLTPEQERAFQRLVLQTQLV